MTVARFVFRVDSSRQIGGGHLARCLTLAKGLKEKGSKCIFICRDLAWNLNALVISEGFELIELPRSDDAFLPPDKSAPAHSHWLGVKWDIDALETLNALNRLNADWIIVDHYGLWEDWQHVVRRCGAKIMVIDDLGDRKHHCDLLLDQNLGSDTLGYKGLIPSVCETLFGPDYALLRPEFKEYREASLARRVSYGIENILINFGGGDPDNHIARVLRALLSIDISSNVTISIIFGGLSAINEEHRQLISQFPNTITSYGMVSNMAEILSVSDLVIGAAGSSSWERCCLGVPSIIFPVALNQSRIAGQLSKCGAAIALTNQDLSNGHLGLLVNQMLQSQDLAKMSKIAATICDGNGLAKVIGIINA
jgi:UDP-2,4-diacetamido-2,4,6-trideoxy-beta-L-altropyranose hydrolase